MQTTSNRLHLGCGTKYMEGWVNVDSDPEVKADWHGDCNSMPFADDTFEEVMSHHTLEHFTCIFTILGELARVSKDGALHTHTVPMWSWPQNMGNPYHHINFSPTTFKFFDRENGIYKRGQKQPYSLKEVDTTFNEQEITFKLILTK